MPSRSRKPLRCATASAIEETLRAELAIWPKRKVIRSSPWAERINPPHKPSKMTAASTGDAHRDSLSLVIAAYCPA